MIYFDNCSTTHKKPISVIKAINKGLTKLNYNPGRAGYKNAIKTNLEVLFLRERACSFFNCDNPSQVIITKSCTESINIALRSNVKAGGHIISTIYEHNAVLRTLEHLKQKYAISYTLLQPDKNGKISNEDILKNINNKTYMVVINHISNVTGSIQDIQSIGNICKKQNLYFVVDGAQSAGHVNIDIKKMHINYLAIAGHKGLFGPQGIGLLICNKATPKPLIYGGTGTFSSNIIQPTDIPEGLESGTMSIANILGLKAGIEYCCRHSAQIKHKTKQITQYIYNNLQHIPNITIYSPKNCVGVISINLSNLTSSELSTELDNYNIATRSGLHCAPKIHEYYGTINKGMTRIGVSYFNSISDAKKLINALINISKKHS